MPGVVTGAGSLHLDDPRAHVGEHPLGAVEPEDRDLATAPIRTDQTIAAMPARAEAPVTVFAAASLKNARAAA